MDEQAYRERERAFVTGLLAVKKWHFATTYPQSPHWYTLRNEWGNYEEFVAVVKYIRAEGVKEVYEGSTYTVLHHGDWKYWTMFAPAPQTTLINRTYSDDDLRDELGRMLTDGQLPYDEAIARIDARRKSAMLRQ